jgi:drug/metabolite transporter (DMT)-like permease
MVFRLPTARLRARLGQPGIGYALSAAVLFGAATPLAKYLLGTIDPWLLAGLLYLGSGVGLTIYRAVSRSAPIKMSGVEARWLAAAILAGGIIAPVLLMYGLVHLPSSATALLLNAEGVLTVVIAWLAFREHFDKRIAFGMASITLGALILSWPTDASVATLIPSLAVLGACLAWAIDNNLTRKVSLVDPTVVASLKGLVAGVVNLSLAFGLGASVPPLPQAALAMGTGLLTYGTSLVLFVLALRSLGTARTSAYFSIAPFIGAAIGLISGEAISLQLVLAAVLMAFGIWLHVTEVHTHMHIHEPMEHTHSHTHDEHHQHEHDEPVAAGITHTHAHVHARLQHAHRHFPDAHHQHLH